MKPTVFCLSLLLASALTSACRPTNSGAVMTPSEIDASGTHTYAAPPAEVFTATVGALQTLGYRLTVANDAKGIIKTDRKAIRADAAGGNGVAVAVEVTRQYYLRISSTDGSNSTVVAEPKVFIGERDVSGDPVWMLDGPEGERTLWKRLFDEIQSNL